METKAFRIDWYPRGSYIDFCELKAEEIGVLMQIINLIYSHNGAIRNDPKHIGKSCNLTKKKCEKIIHRLIQAEHLYEPEVGMLYKKRCKQELEALQKRRKTASKNGKKGAETRWESQQNQRDSHRKAISLDMASTSTSQSNSKNTMEGDAFNGDEFEFCASKVIRGGVNHFYNIENKLSDSALKEARSYAPNCDIYAIMNKYNEGIKSGEREPPRYPSKAFPAWVKKYVERQNS